jgi:diaminopimelate epimerase
VIKSGQPKGTEEVVKEIENVGDIGPRGFPRSGGSGVIVQPAVISFVKASACSNDFLLVESSAIDNAIPADMAVLTRRMCDRHEGVGADGVEWIYPHATADAEIRLINADGSEAEISGNGTRCVAAYICAERAKERITIQTGAGLKTCALTARGESEYEFEVEMGEAAIQAELTVKIPGEEVRGIPLSMGNPHYVMFVPEFADNWQRKAAEIQRSSEFKHGVNVEMVVIEGRHDVNTRFFERGVGETQSSGPGSCAAAAAAMALGKTESPVRVHTPGGVQTVRKSENLVFLRGTAKLVCRGEFFLS